MSGPSPSKTGGQIKITNLEREHITHDPYGERDAMNIIEGEARLYTKSDLIRRFVEQIVTGTFLNVKKDVNLEPETKNIGAIDKMDIEKELLRNQVLWQGRVNALFSGCLGTLSGMSMLHIITVLSISDKLDFMRSYARFARNINIIFLVLANLGLVLGIALSLIYKQKSQEKMRTLDNSRAEHRAQYTVAVVISVIMTVCWVILLILPMYTIKIHYM